MQPIIRVIVRIANISTLQKLNSYKPKLDRSRDFILKYNKRILC
jgi:hypothetical protein